MSKSYFVPDPLQPSPLLPSELHVENEKEMKTDVLKMEENGTGKELRSILNLQDLPSWTQKPSEGEFLDACKRIGLFCLLHKRSNKHWQLLKPCMCDMDSGECIFAIPNPSVAVSDFLLFH